MNEAAKIHKLLQLLSVEHYRLESEPSGEGSIITFVGLFDDGVATCQIVYDDIGNGTLIQLGNRFRRDIAWRVLLQGRPEVEFIELAMRIYKPGRSFFLCYAGYLLRRLLPFHKDR